MKRTEIFIESERLVIMALDARRLALWLDDTETFEAELGISGARLVLDDEFSNVVRGQLEKVAADPKNCVFLTFWLMVNKESGEVVGSIDFKGLPDARGEVEIGYGLVKEQEHHGYMTEAVRAFCDYANERGGIFRVVAETERYNLASQLILMRCGFTLTGAGKSLWWALSLDAPQKALIREYLRASVAQDAEGIRKCFRRDAVVAWHNTNELFTLEEYIRADCEYPGNWRGEVERVSVENGEGMSVVRVTDGVDAFRAVSFYLFEEGRILRVDEYWGDEGEAPKWRRELGIGRALR